MKKFAEFRSSLLIEKVMQKEINQSLGNKNGLMRGEFNLIIENLYNDKLFSKAVDEYHDWQSANSKLRNRIVDMTDALERDINAESISPKQADKRQRQIDALKTKQPQPGSAYMKYLDMFDPDAKNKLDEYGLIDFPELHDVSGTEVLKRNPYFQDILKSAPFSKYVIGSEEQLEKHSGDFWKITNEHNLSRGGVSINSPWMKTKEFMTMLPKMLEWIKSHGFTDSSTPFNLDIGHRAVKNFSKKNLNFSKLMLLTDEDDFYESFTKRPITSSILRAIDDLTKRNAKEVEGVLNRNIAPAFKFTKYFGPNSTIQVPGYIAFKRIGGKNYEENFPILKNAISKLMHYALTGFDPEYRADEYHSKIFRFKEHLESAIAKDKLKVLRDILAVRRKEKNSTDLDKKVNDHIEAYIDTVRSQMQYYAKRPDRRTTKNIKWTHSKIVDLVNSEIEEFEKELA